jgi:uroporphyrinogen-III decarboxylase
MKKEQMNSRERWLAAINLQALDRLPFWPKLDGAYLKNSTSKFTGWKLEQFHEYIGSDRHEGLGSCIQEKHTRCSIEVIEENNTQTTIYHTPHRDLRLAVEFDEQSVSWHPSEFPVKSAEDIKAMTCFFDDLEPVLEKQKLDETKTQKKILGDQAVTATCVGESPLMYWVEWLAGVENAHYLLIDCQQEVEELFCAIHRQLIKKTEIIGEYHPADLIYFVENTSTTLISPDQYKQYCFKHLTEYGNILRQHERNFILHMCGHLKALLPDLAKVPAKAFEAFTSPTLGNTTLLAGRNECPEKCLIGGTNAMLWTKSPQEIIAQVESDLNDLPHHRGIVVTSAGVMPPLCAPDTIKAVCEWTKQYPVCL